MRQQIIFNSVEYLNFYKDAIVSFQTSKGLQVDGIVGIKTWVALLWI
ncbi:peptidoglycan-binding protein [Nostoc sp. CHAB 5784]|nr:peptidoglycan-binding domain-containing protein [Nostoc mirabile]MCC5663318.1 peptidoglycan-binding protein [Nostoc mirabile CHAB5784]